MPLYFWQGQKDLVFAPLRSARGRAPLALAHPSARGFGVDVEKRSRKRGRGRVTPFSKPSRKRVVLIWCWKQPEKVNVQLGVKL